MDKPVFVLKIFQWLNKNKETEAGKWHKISEEPVSKPYFELFKTNYDFFLESSKQLTTLSIL